MKRTRTVAVDNTPYLEAEPTQRLDYSRSEEHIPIIVKPIIEKPLNQHEIFKNQMEARIQIRKEKYNKLFFGAF